MELFEAMSTCRSIRRYRSDPVDEYVLWQCLKAAGYAPSGSNAQDWRIIVMDSPEARAILGPAYRRGAAWSMGVYGVSRPDPDDMSRRARMTRSMFDLVDDFEQIPYYVLFCTETWDNLPELLTGSCVYPAMQNFMLAARHFGLGTLPTMWFMECEDELHELLELPRDWHMVALMPLGYPQGRHGPVHRKPIEQLVHWNRYGNQRGAPPDLALPGEAEGRAH
jgi:nitroreductase